jgi:hypothetical protein
VLHVAATPKGLSLSCDGAVAYLLPVSPTEFVSTNSGARLHFDGAIAGRPHRLILVQDGRRFECSREAPRPGRAMP